MFVRIGYLYPSRTPVLRGLTVALGASGRVDAGDRLAMPMCRLAVVVSLFFPVYYTVLSLVLTPAPEEDEPCATPL